MSRTDQFRMNRLLASLPKAEWERWSAALEAVEMPLGAVLYEPGVTLRVCVFSDYIDRIAALCHGERSLGGNRRRRE